MSRPEGARRVSGAQAGVYILLALIAIYLVAISGMVYGLVTSGEPIGFAMGAALVVFPVVGIVFIWKDVRFARRGDRLLRALAEAGELPEDTLPKRPSGRPVREAADADFERWKQEVEAAPEDYRAWARLALAYRASGDTARARRAMRQALELESRAG